MNKFSQDLIMTDIQKLEAVINIDGASSGNPGPAGLGVLICHPEGEIYEKISEYIGEATNNIAEYRAFIKALERSKVLGLKDIQILSDSELLVKQVLGEYKIKNKGIMKLAAEASQICKFFNKVHLKHIPREENITADKLAQLAIKNHRTKLPHKADKIKDRSKAGQAIAPNILNE